MIALAILYEENTVSTGARMYLPRSSILRWEIKEQSTLQAQNYDKVFASENILFYSHCKSVLVEVP